MRDGLTQMQVLPRFLHDGLVPVHSADDMADESSLLSGARGP